MSMQFLETKSAKLKYNIVTVLKWIREEHSNPPQRRPASDYDRTDT